MIVAGDVVCLCMCLMCVIIIEIFIIKTLQPDDARTVFTADGKYPHIQPLQDTAQLYRAMRNMSLGLGNMYMNE
jgi:hypothetical protein